MLVRDWMSSNLITASPDTTLLAAAETMKEHSIRRLPVVDDDGRVLGIISDRDLKAASPSLVSTIDVHEHHYLFREFKVKDIMTRKVVSVSPGDTVERAAVLMHQRKISGLPVIQDDCLVGVITLDDVSRVLTTITGSTRGGTQIALTLEDHPGSVGEMVQLIKQQGGFVISVLSVHDMCEGGCLNVYVRIEDLNDPEQENLTAALEQRYEVQYVVRNELNDL
jgi:acetoin utilization protein AcuB